MYTTGVLSSLDMYCNDGLFNTILRMGHLFQQYMASVREDRRELSELYLLQPKKNYIMSCTRGLLMQLRDPMEM